MRQLTSGLEDLGKAKISKLPMRQLTEVIGEITVQVFSKLPMRQLTKENEGKIKKVLFLNYLCGS